MTGLSKLYRYRKILVTALLCCTLLVAASWAIQSKMTNIAAQNASNVLSTVLGATHQGVRSWFKGQKTEVLIWASRPNLRQYAAELLATSKTPAALKSAPAQKDLRAWLAPVLAANEYKGFFIIGPDGLNLASTRDANLGIPSLLMQQPGFLNRVWAGQPSMSAPLQSDVPLLAPDGTLVQGLPTMFVGAPISDEQGNNIAILAFRLDPFADFTAILQQGRVGSSGETYAFDRNGRMISESRFKDRLVSIGLIERDSYAIFSVEIRDPGANLLLGEPPNLERSQQPLTLMAQKATAGESGTNVDGYRDYRGVPVVGAWIWDRKLNIGIASEIDHAEAFASVRANQTIFTLATVLLALLTAGLGSILVRSQEREKTRAAIKEREKRLTHVVTGVPHGIAMFDSDQRLLAWNDIYKNTFQFPDEFMHVGMEGSELALYVAERGYYGDGDPQTMAGKRLEFLRTSQATQSEITIPDGRTFEVLNRLTNEGYLLSTYTDITARKRMEDALRESEKNLKTVLEAAPQGIALYDSDRKMVAWNDRYQEFFHYPDEFMHEGMDGRRMMLYLAEQGFYGEGDPKQLEQERQDYLWETDDLSSELQTPYGKTLEARFLRTNDGQLLLTYTDITERKQAEDAIRYMANHDTLTGLASLRLGRDRLDQAIASAHRHKLKAALLFVDLDGFKAVNDTLGHDAGDAVLKGVAERLEAAVRETDTVARVGGDEFLVIMTDVKERDAAAVVAEKLLHTLAEPFSWEGKEARIGASIGIALYPDHGDDGETILKKADEAMYAIKKSGKNNFAFVA